MNCVFCQHEVLIIDRIGVRDDCEHCGSSLHCCLQCQFYDRSAYHECKERVQFRVEHKDRPNYCEFFAFGRDAKEELASKEKIKNQLDELFKK